MYSFIESILSTEGFPPRWECGTAWTPALGWTHILSDITIFAAYTMIPLILAFFIFVRKDFPFQGVFVLFIAFIFLCGTGHLIEASIFWEPWYRLSALVKLLTAVVSVFTVVALMRFIPQILKLPRFLNLQLQTILENAPDAIIITDQSGSVETYNPAAERLFQYQASEVTGGNISLLIPEENSLTMDDYIVEKESEGDDLSRHVDLRRKDGKLFPTEISHSEVTMGAVRRRVYIIRDLSRRKYEEKILQYTRDLERSNEDLNSFAYIASHDLKTPLRAIDALSKFIYKDCFEILPDASKEHLKKMQQRVVRMENLLDGLLNYSRVGKKNPEPEEVNFRDLLQDVLEDASVPDDFTFDIPDSMPTLVTSKSLLYNVMQNLIGNAIKYRAPDRAGHVKITSQDLGDLIEISVNDNGSGIPVEYHEKVFQMFQRLHSQDEIEGNGIGLAMVKKIVEGMGGEISIDPNTEIGTSLKFTWLKHRSGCA